MSLMPTLTRIIDTQHKQIRTQNIADVGYHMASSDYTIHLRSHNKCSILAYVATPLFCAFRPVQFMAPWTYRNRVKRTLKTTSQQKTLEPCIILLNDSAAKFFFFQWKKNKNKSWNSEVFCTIAVLYTLHFVQLQYCTVFCTIVVLYTFKNNSKANHGTSNQTVTWCSTDNE